MKQKVLTTKYAKIYVRKHKPNGEIGFRQVYFNSTPKTVINHNFSLENSFPENLYRIDNWVNPILMKDLAGLLN